MPMVSPLGKLMTVGAVLVSFQPGWALEMQSPLERQLSLFRDAEQGPLRVASRLTLERAEGLADADPNRLSSRYAHNALELGMIATLNSATSFHLSGSIGSRAYSAETLHGPTFFVERSQSAAEITAGPTMSLSTLVLGGLVHVSYLGNLHRREKTDLEDTRYQRHAAITPSFSIFAGLSNPQLTGILGVRIQSPKNVASQFTDAEGKSTAQETITGTPGQLWFDGHFQPWPELTLSGAIVWRIVENIAADQWEYRREFSPTDPERKAQLGLPRQANHFHMNLQGSYQANSDFTLLAGISYREPSFSRLEFADLEDQNLGGVEIHVGGKIALAVLTTQFRLGYGIPQPTRIETTPNSTAHWSEQQTRIRMEQSFWHLEIGLARPL